MSKIVLNYNIAQLECEKSLTMFGVSVIICLAASTWPSERRCIEVRFDSTTKLRCPCHSATHWWLHGQVLVFYPFHRLPPHACVVRTRNPPPMNAYCVSCVYVAVLKIIIINYDNNSNNNNILAWLHHTYNNSARYFKRGHRKRTTKRLVSTMGRRGWRVMIL